MFSQLILTFLLSPLLELGLELLAMAIHNFFFFPLAVRDVIECL